MKKFTISSLVIVIAFILLGFLQKDAYAQFGVGEFICEWDENDDGIGFCGGIGNCDPPNSDIGFPDGTTCFNRGGSFVDNETDCEQGNPHPCLEECTPPGRQYCDEDDRSAIYECADDGSIIVAETCATGICIEDDDGPSCQTADPPPPPVGGGFDNPLGGSGGGVCGENELDTAIGCIPILGGNEFINFFLTWAIGIAGGVALLLIVYAGVQITTSAGDPKKLTAGKELLTAALGGFLFLLFSVYLLEFIGVDILQIPEF